MSKNGRQEHVIKLLGLKDNKYDYGFKRKKQVRWEVDCYKKFYEILQFQEYDIEGDKIFKYFMENGITLNSLFIRSVEQKEQYSMIYELYEKQKRYGDIKKMGKQFALEEMFNSGNELLMLKEGVIDTLDFREENSTKLEDKEGTTEILDSREQKIRKYDMKDVMIEMSEYNGSIYADDGKTIKHYFEDINNSWVDMANYYNKILEMLLDPERITIRNRLKEAFEIEKKYYTRIKWNKTNSYWPEIDNIYVNLYLYGRNRYMKQFYVALLPDYSLFSDIKSYKYNLKKEYYSLPDLAHIYAGMIGKDNEDDYKKIRQNMIKAFQKIKYVKKFKRDINKTAFGLQEVIRIPLENDSTDEPPNYNIRYEELAEALSAYLFFKKKHKEKDYTIAELDTLFRNVYGKILSLLVEYYSSSSVNFTLGIERVLEEIVNHYKGEFYDTFTSLNSGYQMAMLDELFVGMQRIYTYAATGCSVECVWGIRNREANT